MAVVAVVLRKRIPDDTLVCMNKQHLRWRERRQPVPAAAAAFEIIKRLPDGPTVYKAPVINAVTRIEAELRQQSRNTLCGVWRVTCDV